MSVEAANTDLRTAPAQDWKESLMPSERTLLMIPTYNEAENVERIYQAIMATGLDIDFLFVDDNSPDGTGRIIDRLVAASPQVFALHREGKLGVGAAHQAGIAWAYERGYQRLVTMDCDFTHDPGRIGAFLEASARADVVIGSRFLAPDSLDDWVWYRKLLTHVAHLMTRIVLGLPFDGSGAFRVYRLDKVPQRIFALVQDRGYSFFWESLYIIWINRISIEQIAIPLPARTYGHSKMRLRDIGLGLRRLGTMFWRRLTDRQSLMLSPVGQGAGRSNNAQEWDAYWQPGASAKSPGWYDFIARFYRYRIIQPSLDRFVAAQFRRDSRLLHAGCGSGEVDSGVLAYANVTALDISPKALERYRGHHGDTARLVNGSILDIPEPDQSFDGVYSLGVLEHFSHDEIASALKEFRRVLVPGGRVVLFWPPVMGLSVMALHLIHFVRAHVFGKHDRLHPDEPSLIRSRRQAQDLLDAAGLKLTDYAFGPRDAFTYAVIIGERPADGS
jgi:dolichol-phosphate mannosyltransferase